MIAARLRHELRAMAVPTLVVHGTEDRSVPVAFGRLTARLVPGCRFIEYQGAPHGLRLSKFVEHLVPGGCLELLSERH